MSKNPWIVLMEVYDRVEAEGIKAALEAEGIEVFLSQEAAGSLLPVSFGELGRIQVLVQDKDFEEARKWVEAYEGGKLDGDDPDGEQG